MTTALDSHAQQMRQALWTMVRRRVPERDAEDVVQSVLAEAIASPHRPEEPESARRWIWGMARNKIADYHRRTRREAFVEVETSVSPNDDSAREILEWAAAELPPGLDEQRTFEWLLREGEGEKLEEIARSENIPAARVRQRVSRLRRHFRARWSVYAALLGVTTLIVMWLARRDRASDPEPSIPTMQVQPDRIAANERARVLRDEAQVLCGREEWSACLERLDEARRFDPLGDDALEVRALREAATRGVSRSNGAREPGMPSTIDRTRDAYNRQRVRDQVAARGIFAALGDPRGGRAGGASGIVSPFGGVTAPGNDSPGDTIGDAFGYGGLGATGTGWGGDGSGEGSIGLGSVRHMRRHRPASRSSGAPP